MPIGATSLVVTIALLAVCGLVVLLKRSALARPIGEDEIGKDHPSAAEAEAALIQQHKKLISKKTD